MKQNQSTWQIFLVVLFSVLSALIIGTALGSIDYVGNPSISTYIGMFLAQFFIKACTKSSPGCLASSCGRFLLNLIESLIKICFQFLFESIHFILLFLNQFSFSSNYLFMSFFHILFSLINF